jgi:hypothetical protein
MKQKQTKFSIGYITRKDLVRAVNEYLQNYMPYGGTEPPTEKIKEDDRRLTKKVMVYFAERYGRRIKLIANQGDGEGTWCEMIRDTMKRMGIKFL